MKHKLAWLSLPISLIVASLVLFIATGNNHKCTHGVSSTGPVTIIHGKVHIVHKAFTQACLH